MKQFNLIKSNKKIFYQEKINSKGDFIKFVANELRKIAKKNLKIPVSLYHL